MLQAAISSSYLQGVDPLCDYSQVQIYFQDSIRCIAVAQVLGSDWNEETGAIAQTAFERFASAAMRDPANAIEILVALDDFLTFTQAHGWYPIYFDVVATALPALQALIAASKQMVAAQ